MTMQAAVAGAGLLLLLLPACATAAPVPTTNASALAWELVGRMPTARLGLASVYEPTADRIYCLGGEQFATNLATAESVDPADPLDGWRAEQDMPEPRWQNAAAAVPGRVYTMGGFAETQPIASMVSIDTATGAWRTETPMPTPRALLSAVYASSNGFVYAMGGRGAQDPFDPVVATVEKYDPITGEWTAEPDMPEQRQGAAGVYVPEVDRIYVLGGGNGNGAELPTVDSMDVATGQWRQEEPVR
jgi:N-acetylneuraminic acid mutarotase